MGILRTAVALCLVAAAAGARAGDFEIALDLRAVSSDGQLASISAQTGEILNTTKISDAFYIAPVIANGTVYLLSDDAELIALR